MRNSVVFLHSLKTVREDFNESRMMSPKVAFTILFLFIVHWEGGGCYRTEVEIAPSEETTTKSSGFFGGIKNFFRGSPSTSTTTMPPNILLSNPKTTPPPSKFQNPQQPSLAIPQAPLMPLGPRPDTPGSSPFSDQRADPFKWPQNPSSSTIKSPIIGDSRVTPIANSQHGEVAAPNKLPPGFAPYRSNNLQPSGLDLSYGPQEGTNYNERKPSQPGSNLIPLQVSTTIKTTTTTATTPRTLPQPTSFNINRKVDDGTDHISTNIKTPATFKEEFPALPTPTSSIHSKVDHHPSPSAWNEPLNIPSNVDSKSTSTITSTKSSVASHPEKVSFVPHIVASTTTVRPGFESNTPSLATDDEIRSLTEQLYQKETSQLEYIQMQLQGKTRSIDSNDEAKNPLFIVNEKVFDYPSISKMKLLFNNYESDTTTNEYVTPNERKEENDFLDSIMSSAVMRHTMQFLQNKGLVTPDPKTHRDLVKELWFTQYSRGKGKIGSSGFEHVFVNEVKNGTIIGLHNWIYFYEEENAGRIDYKGYINELNLGNKGKVLKIRFTHNNLNKPVNTMFVGTSPELEMALYTLCFKLKPDRSCPVSLGNSKFGIVTYSWRYRGKNLVGSAYPEI